MDSELPYEKILRESLKDELRVMNAHLPCCQKSLADLLQEEYPAIPCNDGTTHLFKKKELGYLAGLVSPENQTRVFLPIIIEISAGMEKMEVVCRNEVEDELIMRILDMKLTAENHRMVIFAPQLAALRRVLKTTTQYVFSLKMLP